LTAIKRKSQGGSSTANPLILIGIFASLTILVADYLIIQTMGSVQMLLTVFVVVFPVLIASALFYFLINQDYLLFVRPEIGNEVVVKGQIEAVKKQRNKKSEYDPAIHALLGMLEAVRLNAPALNQRHPDVNPVLPIQVNLGAFPPSRDRSHQISQVTAGSVTREEAARRFHFLVKDCGKNSVKEAIQQLVKTNKTFHVWIGSDGSAEECSETDAIEETIQLSINRDGKEKAKNTEYIYVQIIYALHDQLIVVYFQGELLGFRGSQTVRFVKGMQTIKAPYSDLALVISDEGDLYGTMEDIFERANLTSSQDNPIGCRS
jgi:hypothetical protein